MRSTIQLSTLVLAAILSFNAQAQVISVTESAMVVQPGTDLNMGGLLLQPSRELVLENFSLSRSSATPVSTVNRSYQVFGTVPSFSGVVNVLYETAELQGLNPQTLSILVKDPRSWKSLQSFPNPDLKNSYQSQSLNSLQLTAITLGAEAGQGYVKILNNPVITSTLLVSSSESRPLNVFSSDGKLVFKVQLNPGINKLDMGRYAKGTYVANSGMFSEKVVLR